MAAPRSFFRVRYPFLALKSLTSRQVYVILPVGATGEIVESSDDLERPGLVVMKVDGETLVTWARDLQQCTDNVSSQLRLINGGAL